MPTDQYFALRRVELQAQLYRQQLDAAKQLIAQHNEEVEPIRRAYAPRMRHAAAEVQRAKKALINAVETAREHFRRPKSRILHGISVGFRKVPDKWLWPAESDLVKRVRDKLPLLAPTVVEVTERVRKDALTAEQRELLEVPCRPGKENALANERDSDVERSLATLLEGLPKDEEAAA